MNCDSCRENTATIFLTQMLHGQTAKLNLCEDCARQKALGSEWAQQFAGGAFQAPLEEIVRELFQQINEEKKRDGDDSEAVTEIEISEIFFGTGEFPGDEDLVDEMDEDELEEFDEQDEPADAQEAALNSLLDGTGGLQPFFEDPEHTERREIIAKRCPKCATTWDRLRQDGRAGCARCYETFAEQLREVMQRVQRGTEHTGKRPQAADKRRRKLEQLRAKRDNRLDMLKRRLQEALQEEKYEEAAKLRDQIRMVESTIVQPLILVLVTCCCLYLTALT